MALTKGMLSSDTIEWATPIEFFQQLDDEFGFTLDVCATPDNAKCERFFTKDDDGLKQSWGAEICWMNPPYGREIGAWMYKARYESEHNGATVVCLVPARTDTRWWWETAMSVWPSGIRFIQGRIKFNNAGSAPFPSVVVVFEPDKSEAFMSDVVYLGRQDFRRERNVVTRCDTCGFGADQGWDTPLADGETDATLAVRTATLKGVYGCECM